jgi:hypothetical protein
LQTQLKSAARCPLRTISGIASYLVGVILFPIALIWLVVALIWIVRNSTNEPDVPEPTWKRFVPRVPKRPWNRPGSSDRAKAGAGSRHTS